MALITIRDQVSFPAILKSSEPNFMDLKRDWGVAELAKPVMALTKSFMDSQYPDQVGISLDVAVALIDREPTWTLPDVINFYKTIINRQDIEGFNVFGNKITVLRLMEMVGVYEELKAEAREKELAEERGNYLTPMPRTYSDQSVKAHMGKLLENVNIKNDLVTHVYNTPANEKWFNKNPLSSYPDKD